MKGQITEIKWLNIAKMAAIIGVLVQHVNYLLYSNQKIYQSATYAVAVFIVIGGYLTACSFDRKGTIFVVKKIARLLIPYIVATGIYLFYMERTIDLENMIYHVMHFDASGPFYYVWVYGQLLIMSPVLIAALNWADWGGGRNM